MNDLETITMLVETVPVLKAERAMLAADCEALQRRCTAQAKALAVVLSKYDNHPAEGIPDQFTHCRYIGITPGEAAVMRKAVGG